VTSPTQGAFNLEIKGKTDTQYSLQNQIDNFEIYIASKQQQLTTQYERVDMMLRQLPLLQQQLDAELGFTSNSKK
jgi:flagellar capping protein FliD